MIISKKILMKFSESTKNEITLLESSIEKINKKINYINILMESF